ncbi:hypothetical protein TeGR_g6930, partial [Tetraparma gracilis]
SSPPPPMAFNFGSPAPSAPAAPAFGSAAPAPGGFSFGAASPAPAAPAFGAAPAPAAPPPLFGAAAGAAPGAAPAAAPLFGAAPAAPAAAVFGAAPAPASFGAAPAPASFGGAPAPALFGAPAPAQSSLFAAVAGAPAAPAWGAPAPVWGAPPPALAPAAAQPPGSAFGFSPPPNPALTPQQQQFQASQHEHLLKLERQLGELHDAYDPASPNCRFKAAFYNAVDPAQRHLYSKPPEVAQEDWTQAEAKNPDSRALVPAPVRGVAALGERAEAQRKASRQLQDYIQSLEKTAETLKSKSKQSEEAYLSAKNNQVALDRRLMSALLKVELFRSMGSPLNQQEVRFREDVKAAHARLDKHQALLTSILSSLPA